MSNGTPSDGDVQIMLGGESVTLRPNVRAAQAISRQTGGILGAVQAVGRFDFDVIVQAIALGMGKFKPDEINGIADQVYETGLTELVASVTTYLTNLANGGRPSAGATGDRQ